MKKSKLKSAIASILIAACLAVPVTAFAAEEHSGTYDYNTMWEMTHPNTTISSDFTGEFYDNSYDDYTPVAGIIGEINVNGVNFRETPSVENKASAILSTGDNVTVLSTEGEWCQVAWNGQVGYIKEERVSVCGLPLNCTQGWVTGALPVYSRSLL